MKTETTQKLYMYGIMIVIMLGMAGAVRWYAHVEPVELVKEPFGNISLEATNDKIKAHIIVKDIRVEIKPTATSTTKVKVDYGDIVEYIYVSDEKQEDIKYGNLKEEKSLRQTNSNTFKLPNGNYLSTINISSYQYEDISEWKKLKKATTTIDNFEDKTKVSLIERLLGKSVYADEDIIYAGAGDGRVYNDDGASTDWNAVHDATTGAYTAPTDDTDTLFGANSTYTISRGFTPINTGATITTGAVVSSSTMHFYTYAQTTNDNDAQAYVVAVQTDQANETTLVLADFNNCGAVDSPTEGSEQERLSTISTNSWYSLTLDATGRGWIKTNGDVSNCGSNTGWTCLGWREGHDVEDIPPTAQNYNNVRYSEYADTASDPHLDVEWALPVVEVDDSGSQPVIWFD